MTEHLPSVIALGWEPYFADDDDLLHMTLLGRRPVKVQRFWAPAVAAMEFQLRATGYEDPCDFIGSWNVRVITGTNFWSWHSYGGAIDLDYGGDTDGDGDPTIDKNPHIHRKIYPGDSGFGVVWQILEHQVHAIEAIRTNNGKRVWRWLGWSIGDTMHWEPACTPDDIKTGIDPQSLIGGSMNCPWTNVSNPAGEWYSKDAPCNDHYDFGKEIEWGVNTGVCSTPSWGENGMDYGVATKRINPKDNHRDEFTEILTKGTWLTMESRAKELQ